MSGAGFFQEFGACVRLRLQMLAMPALDRGTYSVKAM